jgi:hypothetical protein
MSLGLFDPTPRHTSSVAFNDAVNDARFVRTFGIIAAIGSLLTFVSGAIGIGIGVAVIGFGHTRFFKMLGWIVIAFGVASFLAPLLGIAGSLALSIGVLVKTTQVLRVLAREGKDDPDWSQAQLRSMVGLAGSVLGVLLSLLWAGLIGLGMLLEGTGELP